jgi:hypothetical protein
MLRILFRLTLEATSLSATLVSPFYDFLCASSFNSFLLVGGDATSGFYGEHHPAGAYETVPFYYIGRLSA